MEKIPYLVILILLSLTIFFVKKFFVTKNVTLDSLPTSFKYNYIGKIWLFIIYIIYTFFTVFRVIDVGIGGIDAYVYKLYFLGAKTSWIEAIEYQNYEVGYATIIWLFRLLTDDYRFVLFFLYTFMFIVLVVFVRYITFNMYTFLSIFLLLALIINSFNTLRVIIAVFIGMVVYIQLFKSKYLNSILLSIVAISIHISALILFPIISVHFIINKRKNISFKKLIFYVCSLSIITVVLMWLAKPIIMNSNYHIYNNEGGIALQTYIMILILFLLSVLKYKQMVNINKFNKTLITILPIGLIILPLQMEYSILYRMVLYFLPIIYSLIPPLIRSLSITSIKKIHYFFIKLGLVLYLILKIIIFFTVEVKSAGLPYINMFFNH